MDKHLHIVCFDVPFPVNHGGLFDLFYKLVALHREGVQIHLHCFEYGKGPQEELGKYCAEVHYYQRKQGVAGMNSRLPYIVSSRIDESLYQRLLQDDHPILLEGVHCAYLLHDSRFSGRKIFLRLHNVEHLYYRHLFQTSRHLFKKIYFWNESRLLKRFEKSIAGKAIVLPVSETDGSYYRTELGATQVMPLPVFLPFDKVTAEEGLGCYCLYHGNLSVPENEKAAAWLLREVFNDLNIPLVIAGRKPSERLHQLSHRQTNTCLVADPSWQDMQDMIRKAQIHLVPSFNATGVKLKLLNVLFNGRHCIANPAALEGSGLGPACHSVSSAQSFKSVILQLYHQPFGEEEIRLRKQLLEAQFNNQTNARRLIKWIW